MDKNDERVLVVPASIIFEKGRWQGLKTDNLDYYLDLIKNNYQFKRRGDVETDSSLKQIIPYMLFSFQNSFFAYKYLANAGEKRLVGNNYQLGVGGHINNKDMVDGADVLKVGMEREWNEEVNFNGNFLQKKLVGIVNDDSMPVESVHLGLVYHFIGDSPSINIKETNKMEGRLLSEKEILEIDHSIWMKAVYREYISKL